MRMKEAHADADGGGGGGGGGRACGGTVNKVYVLTICNICIL